MSDNDFPCCAPASNLRPDSGVIERVKAVLYKKGAYCGVCDFDPEPCSECDQCLTGYAQALAAAGLLTPSDADVAERIGAILREHQPTSGMQVASGVTCRCGYWTGEERPGVTRPVGYSGLMWHQAQMIATPPVAATPVGLCEHAESEGICTRSVGHEGAHVLAANTQTAAEDRFLALAARFPIDPSLKGQIDAHEGDSLSLGHYFLGVRGVPDDDECTYRSDGTDWTYCGETEAAHYEPVAATGEGDGR